jgi:hypothetical protein
MGDAKCPRHDESRSQRGRLREPGGESRKCSPLGLGHAPTSDAEIARTVGALLQGIATDYQALLDPAAGSLATLGCIGCTPEGPLHGRRSCGRLVAFIKPARGAVAPRPARAGRAPCLSTSGRAAG